VTRSLIVQYDLDKGFGGRIVRFGFVPNRPSSVIWASPFVDKVLGITPLSKRTSSCWLN